MTANDNQWFSTFSETNCSISLNSRLDSLSYFHRLEQQQPPTLSALNPSQSSCIAQAAFLWQADQDEDRHPRE